MMGNTSTSTGLFTQLNIPSLVLMAYRAGKSAMSDQQYQEAITYFSTALQDTTVPDIFRARAFEQRGECHWLLADHAAAKQDYNSALTSCDDPAQQARARVRLGDIADATGLFDEAKRLYDAGLREGTIASDLLAIGRAHRGLGIVNRRLGNAEQSLTHLTQALAAFRQAGEAREQGRALTSLGITHHARGEYHQAISNHAESLRIFESLGDRWRITLSLNNLGECHQSLYDIDMAQRFLDRAFAMAEKYEAEILYPEIQHNLGVSAIMMGELDKGVELLEYALVKARKFAKRELEARILHDIARAYLQGQDLEKAELMVADLGRLANQLDADRFRALASFAEGELMFAKGNSAEAVMALQTATLAAQTAVDRGTLWKLHAAISHMIDNPAIAAVHMQIAADFIRQTAEPLQDPQLKQSFLNAPPVLAVLTAAGIDVRKI